MRRMLCGLGRDCLLVGSHLALLSSQVDHRVKEGAWRARLLKRDDKRLMLEGEIREFVTALRSKVCAKLHFSTEFVGCLLP